LSRRAVNYLTFLTDSLVRGMTLERPDVVVCMTDPPIVGDLGVLVARRFRVPLVVISQDVFPEFAAELGRLKSPMLLTVLRGLVRFYLRRADRVVAIGETMRARLIAKGARPSSVTVISNWADTAELSPRPRKNDWALEQNLDGAFVVMHSGNVGHAQDIDTLMRAADLLRDLRDLVVVVAGMGARYSDMAALAGLLGLPNVRFLPYQPRARLPESLSTADVHVVGLASGLAGYVVPSRLYGILAVGRPVIVAADAESETARVVSEAGAGVVVPPGQPQALADVIRDLYGRRDDLAEMGRRARAHAERETGRDVAVRRYRELLDDVIRSR
jgi:colanic acid biosynthesis glycosyl transferase WcaI